MKRVLSLLFIVLFLVCALNIPGRLAWAGPNEDLFQAARNGDVGGVEDALRAGADVNARTKVGMTALMDAASWGRANAIPPLLAGGADVNARDNKGETPLMDAVMLGHANAVSLLLEAGADVNARDKRGNTVEDLARATSSLEFPTHWKYARRLREGTLPYTWLTSRSSRGSPYILLKTRKMDSIHPLPTSIDGA